MTTTTTTTTIDDDDNDDDDDVLQKMSEATEHLTRTATARNCYFRDGQRQIGQTHSLSFLFAAL